MPITSLAAASAVGRGTPLRSDPARSKHALQVTAGAGVTAGAVALDVSLDGNNWFTTAASVSFTAPGTKTVALADFPAFAIAANITTAITGGTVTAVIESAP